MMRAKRPPRPTRRVSVARRELPHALGEMREITGEVVQVANALCRAARCAVTLGSARGARQDQNGGLDLASAAFLERSEQQVPRLSACRRHSVAGLTRHAPADEIVDCGLCGRLVPGERGREFGAAKRAADQIEQHMDGTGFALEPPARTKLLKMGDHASHAGSDLRHPASPRFFAPRSAALRSRAMRRASGQNGLRKP